MTVPLLRVACEGVRREEVVKERKGKESFELVVS
jgi:hypothetical protein